ncbi:MAG: hypothetical protein SCK28_07275 [Bacillota bacterium]|nr:hypothetical protein [Bacillota bacterium]
MTNCRCQCGKIVCQLEDNKVIIKCRHCKRFIIIHTQGLLHVEYQTDDEKIQIVTDASS